MARKKSCKAVLVEAVDRISDLPDGILHHALSFLPTYDAVYTCLLSRRWRYLWMGIHTLEFHEADSKIDFINFVHKVLLLHDSTAAIKKFIISILNESHCDDIRALVFKILVDLKLQELNLCIDCSIEFPHNLFSCKSFTVLKLVAPDSTCSLPANVCFPCLKIMFFGYIDFTAGQGVQQVSINCPILEELIIVDCAFHSFDTMHIYAPGLGRLKIEEENDEWISHSPKIKIYAESLVSFDVINGLSYDFSLCDVLCINSVSIDVYTDCYWSSLMQGIQNVKELTLSNYSVTILSSLKNLLALPNLTKLTLGQICDLEVDVFREFFCSLPPVQSLVFTSVYSSRLSEVYDKVAKIPRSFISQLKSFEVRQFYWEESEVSLVEFLLKNGGAMEKMILSPYSGLTKDEKKQNEIMGRLLNLPKASASCLIVFSKKY